MVVLHRPGRSAQTPAERFRIGLFNKNPGSSSHSLILKIRINKDCTKEVTPVRQDPNNYAANQNFIQQDLIPHTLLKRQKPGAEKFPVIISRRTSTLLAKMLPGIIIKRPLHYEGQIRYIVFSRQLEV